MSEIRALKHDDGVIDSASYLLANFNKDNRELEVPLIKGEVDAL